MTKIYVVIAREKATGYSVVSEVFTNKQKAINMCNFFNNEKSKSSFSYSVIQKEICKLDWSKVPY